MADAPAESDQLTSPSAAQGRAHPLEATIHRLEELSALGEDWDSYGSPPPSIEVIGQARIFLGLAARRFATQACAHLEPYAVAPIPGGGVYLEWRSPRFALEVHFGPDGLIGYLLEERRGSERHFDEDDRVSQERVLELLGQVLSDSETRTAV